VIVAKLTSLWQDLRQANELIVSDIDLARTERTQGFQLLRKARSTISDLQEKGIQ
jgi:hypothetical protein